MTEFQIYALDANSLRVSVCRDTKDFTNQQGRGKFQVCYSAAALMIQIYGKEKESFLQNVCFVNEC